MWAGCQVDDKVLGWAHDTAWFYCRAAVDAEEGRSLYTEYLSEFKYNIVDRNVNVVACSIWTSSSEAQANARSIIKATLMWFKILFVFY